MSGEMRDVHGMQAAGAVHGILVVCVEFAWTTWRGNVMVVLSV